MTEAVFDNFVALSELVGFPVSKLFSGSFDSFANFCDLLVGKGIAVDLFPIFFLGVVAIVLGSLSYEEMKMLELFRSGIFEFVDDLNEKLVKFLARNWADFKMVKTLCEEIGDFLWNGGLGDI